MYTFIAIAVELSKGPIVYALQKYDFLVIFPIHPLTLAKYRQAFRPSGAKDDPTDAEFGLDLLLHHPDRLQPLQPQSVVMRSLMLLVEQRRNLVNDRVRITNSLRYALKQYYPQPLEWFDRSIGSVMFCNFIARWPTLKQVKRARKNTLITFFSDHRMHRSQILETRLTAIKAAQPLTLDEAVINPYSLQALVLVDRLRVILQGIEKFEKEIAEVAKAYGLLPRKGDIAPGYDADIVLVDLEKVRHVTPEIWHSAANWSLYDGWDLKGWPVRTMVRGVTVVLDGEIVGSQEHGQYIPRDIQKKPAA